MEHIKDCYWLMIRTLGYNITIRRSNAFTLAGSLSHWKSSEYIKHGTYVVKFNDEILEKGKLKESKE